MIHPVVLVDANVLYSALLRDIVIRCALGRTPLVRVRWTDRILEEAFGNLLKHRSDLDPARLHRTKQLMNQVLPDAGVTNYEHLIPLVNLPDADDRHVLAAAIHCRADLLLTQNVKDFPVSIVQSYGISVMGFDEFLLMLLTEETISTLRRLADLISATRRPPIKPSELPAMLVKAGASQSAEFLAQLWGK
ncbi:PIN domain-containing protein [Staphylococcus chromogenes]|nr:PIN domain-containing protein [Staphylococcus chromogenes]